MACRVTIRLSLRQHAALERFTLPNGLRVVLAPDRSAPVVGVAVVYDVGIRSEPEGRTGFAHLFEHLMFQGSESLEKLAHFRHVQGSGGTFNGSTHLDYTDYYEMLPSNALERALFLEADRMRGPRLTEENLRNQVDVVKEEIRVNVLNRPYGGFPWLKLPPVMFDTFPNAHDGYGSFDDLESATVPDAADFFERYYAAGNAVLSVAGDLDVGPGGRADRAALRRRAGPLRAAAPRLRRAGPDRPSGASPTPTGSPRCRPSPPPGGCPDPIDDFAALPAVRRARRGAHRRRRLPARAAARAHRPHRHQRRRLRELHGRRRSTCATPPPCCCRRTCRRAARSTPVLAAVAEECDRVAHDGLDAGRARPYRRAHVHPPAPRRRHRAQPGAALRRHRAAARQTPALAAELPRLLAEVTEEQVRAAAATLVPSRRAVVEVVPGGCRNDGRYRAAGAARAGGQPGAGGAARRGAHPRATD